MVHMVNFLAVVAASCGMGMLLTAFCEHGEVKFHSKVYSSCVLLTDIAVSVLLLVGAGIGLVSVVAAATSCDPESFTSVIQDAGNDSSLSNPDQAAAMATFFFHMLASVMEDMCKTRGPFTVYTMCCLIGLCGTLTGVLASCCVLSGLTDDGMGGTADDMKAQQMHMIHNQADQGYQTPGGMYDAYGQPMPQRSRCAIL